MKPRLDSAPWTAEDVEAFNMACRDKNNIAAIHCVYWTGDRRDALIMLGPGMDDSARGCRARAILQAGGILGGSGWEHLVGARVVANRRHIRTGRGQAMKPRQRRAPLTTEDWAIWLDVNRRAGYWEEKGEHRGLYGLSVLADRRDADLMLGMAHMRRTVEHIFGTRARLLCADDCFYYVVAYDDQGMHAPRFDISKFA